MKSIKIGVLLFLSLAITVVGMGQNQKIKPWVCANGFWVVESNLKTPLQHKVRFYTDSNLLIGEKEIVGTRLNVKRKKVKMQLKEMLATTLLAWEKQSNSQWVKMQ